MRLLQVIDVGTNSVRSNIVEVPVGGPHRIIDDEKEMTRLGQGLDASGQLDPEAVDRTVSALKAMMDIGRNLGVTEVRAIATEAVRRASNGQELVDRLRRRGRSRRRDHLGGRGRAACVALGDADDRRDAGVGDPRHRRRFGGDRAGRRAKSP